jgi:hypothetical protein
MSDSNRESIGFIAEVTAGVNPGGTKQLINFTSTTLGKTNESTESKFIRADTNRAGTIRTGINANGDIGIELQYGGYDSFLEAALRGTFSTPLAVSATTITVAASDNSYTGSGGTEFTNAVVGQWVKVSGFTTAGNNGWAKVVTKTNAKITVSGLTLTDEASGDAVIIKGAVCKNATTQKSFTVERHFQDISKFILMTGLRVNEMSINFNTAAIAEGSISFLGMNGTTGGSSGFSNSTAAATTVSMNTVDNIKAVYIDGVLATTDFTNLDFTISTNSEALRAIGSLPATAVRQGSISVSGTIGEYFEDTVLLEKSYNFTPIDLAIVTEDAAGNGYVWHFPETYITTGNPDNSGIDTTITTSFNFAATLDATLGITASVSRYAA